MRVRAATRGSPLARWQTSHIAELLRAVAPDVVVEVVVCETEGDRDTTSAIRDLGGRGVFVKEVQAAVLDGRADFAVHSAKDLTSTPEPGLTLASFPERGEARDALVGGSLDDLPPGALIATGSVRRRAQLAAARPDLTFTELRGNMATRLAKVEDPAVDAVVVAAAALQRLGEAELIDELLDPSVVLPQVAQGALAVECRSDDRAVNALLARIDHRPTRQVVSAERGYLAELGGGCDLPAGAHATFGADGSLTLDALLARLDGSLVLRTRERSDGRVDDDRTPVELGKRAARHLLDDAGGRALLGFEE